MGIQYWLEIHNSIVNVHNSFMDLHDYDLPFMILSPLAPHRPMTRTGSHVHYLLRPAWRSQIFLLGTCGPVWIYQAITVTSRDRRPLEYLFNIWFGVPSHKHQYLHSGPFLKGTHWNAEKFSILWPHRQRKIDICFPIELKISNTQMGSSWNCESFIL